MTWKDNLVLTVRVLIGDINAPQKNTDEELQRIIIAAGLLTQIEIDLPNDYVFDISAIEITPDPVVKKDLISQAILPLKAACLINQSNFQGAIGQGIKVRDGDSQIDTSVSFRGYRDILELGPCAAYEKLKWQLQASGSSLAGGAILSPFRGENDSAIKTISFFYDSFASSVHNNHRRRF